MSDTGKEGEFELEFHENVCDQSFTSPKTAVEQAMTPIRTVDKQFVSPLMIPLTPTENVTSVPNMPSMSRSVFPSVPPIQSGFDRFPTTPTFPQPTMSGQVNMGQSNMGTTFGHHDFSTIPQVSVSAAGPTTYGMVSGLSQEKPDHISILTTQGEQVSNTVVHGTSTSRLPPPFDGTNYSSWRKSLYIWYSVNRVHYTQVASLVFQSCQGLAKTVLDSVPTSVLLDNRPDPELTDQTVGFATVMRLLHENFSSFNYDQPHIAFQELFAFKRKQGISWQEYIAEFQSKVREVAKTGQNISDPFLSYLFLENGNLSQNDKKLIFSNLEAKGIPFHMASLDQLIRSVRVIMVQSTQSNTGSITRDEDIFWSEQSRRKFYRPDRYRRQYDSYDHNQSRSTSSYRRNPSQSRNLNRDHWNERDEYRSSDNSRGSYDDSQSYGQGKSRGKGSSGKGQSKGHQNQSSQGKSSGKGQHRSNHFRGHRKGRGSRKGKGHERSYCTENDEACTCQHGPRSSQASHSAIPSDSQASHDIMFNTVAQESQECSDASDYGSPSSCTGNILQVKSEDFLVDQSFHSETIDEYISDSLSEISDLDLDDFSLACDQLEFSDSPVAHHVYGVTSFDIHSTLNQPVSFNSLLDEDLNPLKKPVIDENRKGVLNPKTGEFEYPCNPTTRARKEVELDHYAYETAKGTRRKYIAKGTSCDIGNLKDSPFGIIDTGCTSTIANLNFLSKYEAFLSKIGETRKVIKKKSSTRFRFANGTFGKALLYAEVPVVIGSKEFYLGMHILPTESSELLISLPTLTRMGVKIDFVTQSLSIPSMDIHNFHLPLIGNHVYLPIYWYKSFSAKSFRRYDTPSDDPSISEVLAVAREPLDDTDKFCLTNILPSAFKADIDMTDPKFIIHIHRQYAHRSAEKLYKMFKFAKGDDMPKELTLNHIKQVLEKCPVCASHKTITRPKFGGLLAKQFNEIVAIDLTEVSFRSGKKVLVAHCMDIHSRFSHAEIIPTKEGIHVVDFLMSWQTRAGRAPKHLFSDRGTEFCNELLKQFCSSNGTAFHVTQPYHAHSNGICERRHATLKTRLKFIIEDMKMERSRFSFSSKYLLDMILFSVNSQILDCGYSPFQIAFGIPPVPWLLQSDSGKPSTWIDNTSDYHPLIADRMILQLKVSASAFSHMVNSQLAKAWKSRVYKKDKYENGEQVFFKKIDSRYENGGYWLGPCTVLDLQGKTYILEYGDKTHRINHKEVFSKEQLFPSDYLHLFQYPQPTDDTTLSQDVSDSSIDISRMFDDALQDEYDKLVTHHTPTTDEPRATSSNDDIDDSFVHVTTRIPSSHIPISSLDVSPNTSTHHSTDTQPGSILVNPTASIPTSQATSPPNAIDVNPDSFRTPPARGSQSSEVRGPSGSSDASSRRRPNPLLSPLSTNTARKLMFNLPDDYVSPPKSIFQDTTKVRFAPDPEILEYTPQKCDYCEVIEHFRSDSRDICMPNILRNSSILQQVSHTLDTTSQHDFETCLQTVEVRTSNLRLDASSFVLGDEFYDNVIEEVLDVKDDTGISAYRQPSKDELKLYKADFEESKLKELKSWMENGVFQIVPHYEFREGDNLMTSRWLQNVKTFRDGTIAKFKSRLVIRGFQDAQLDLLRKDSPTADKRSIRLLLQYALDNHYDVHCGDVSTAFLQGEPYTKSENRRIYIRPPKDTNRLIGAEDDAIWFLNKAAYGLADAPKKFYEGLVKTLVKSGMRRSLTDFGLFYCRKENSTVGIVVTHVDDILYSGNKEFLDSVITSVMDKYKFGKVQVNHFDYCGSTITLDKASNTVSISQSHYASKIDLPKLSRKYPPEDSLLLDHYSSFRSCLGKLNWLVVVSRPDLSYSTNTLAQVMTNPTYADYGKLQKTVRLATDHASINLELVQLPTNHERCIVAFSDASHAHSYKDGRIHSQTGSLIFLASLNHDNQWVANLIDWSSKKQKRVCRSTLSSETLASCDTLDRAISLRDTYRNIHDVTLHIFLLVDCKSLAQTAMTTTSIAEKRLQADLGSIRELVENREVTIFHVPTTENIADCLTKPMTLSALHRVLSSHLIPCPEFSV